MAECEGRLTLEEVKEDQGEFENAVSLSDEDLFKGQESCKKSNHHNRFIPAQKFSKSHLPAFYEDQLVVDTVKALSDLTVCIRVKFISLMRPETFSSRNMKYPFSRYRGIKDFARTGTGFIVRVKRKFTESDGKVCKCIKCLKLPREERSRVYGEVMVWSAKHLVFDKDELKQSEIELFFDVPKGNVQGVREAYRGDQAEISATQDRERDGKVQLYPKKMWFSETEGDWCGFYCVTHDLDLWEKLREIYKHSEMLQKETDAKYKDINSHLTICISHPHGLSKQVSIGEWMRRSDIEYQNDAIETYYNYTTPTCEGCSGAPIWIMGRKGRGMFVSHPHSCAETGSSRSAVGFNY